jgi:diguanylate cyclase (GGDEF)-like protein
LLKSRLSSRFALGYIENPGAAAADYSWRIYLVAYCLPPAAFIYLLFPHDEPTNWRWVAIGAACLVLAVGIGALEMQKTTHSDCGNQTTPLMTVVLTQAVLGSILAADLALTPSTGSLRWLLLVPTMVTATFGNRPMFALMGASSLGTMGIVAWTTGAPVGQLVAEILAACAIVAVLRIFAVRTMASFGRDLLFGSMSEVAATVGSLEVGWAQMLPLVCAYLAADQITVVEVGTDDDDRDHDGSGLHEVVFWPEDQPSAWTAASTRELAEKALDAAKPVHVPRGIGIPIAVTQGRQLVAVVAGAEHRFILDMYQETRANHVSQQLGVLVNRIQAIEGLERLIRTDSLTGLLNRRELVERLAEATSSADRSASPLCAAMIDLDFFKSYNDDFGHQAGDQALQHVATLMSTRLRSIDTAFRYGGEEFAILLPSTDEAGACVLLDELRQHVTGLRLHRPLTVSVGIARWVKGESPEELISRADQALYLAKENGRNRALVWQPGAPRPAPREPREQITR